MKILDKRVVVFTMILISGILILGIVALLPILLISFSKESTVAKIEKVYKEEGEIFIIYEYSNNLDGNIYVKKKEINNNEFNYLKDKNQILISYNKYFPRHPIIEGIHDNTLIIYMVGMLICIASLYRLNQTLKENK